MVKKSTLKKRKIKNRAIAAKYIDPLLEYNWKTVEKYFSGGTDLRNEQIRNIYFKKDVKLDPFFSKLTLAALDASKIDGVLAEFANDDKRRREYTESLFKLQEDYQLYFGQNSFFQKREAEILDVLNYPNSIDLEGIATRIERERARRTNEKNLGDYLAVHYGHRYWSAHTVPEHLQLHRKLDITETRLQCIPAQAKKEGIKIAHHNCILGAVVATKHLDKYHKKIGAYAERVVEIYSSNNNPDVVAEYFEMDVMGGYEEFVENSIVGGKVVVCIQYETAEQLTSMLRQMNPDTRFPYCQMEDSNAIHHLTSYEGSVRQSTALINGMWKDGVVFDSYEILESNMLAVTNTVHLNMTGSTKGFELLTFDATEVAKKYLSPNPFEGDEDVFYSRAFPAVAVIENLVGRLFVTWPGRLPIPVDANQKLKCLASASESKIDLCCRMLAPENMKVLEKEIIKEVSKRAEAARQTL